MVNGSKMLISEFARITGLSSDSVRFYVRLGLLEPEIGTKGGRHPYKVFTAAHVEIARIIRMAQSLGFSLKEISALGAEHRSGKMTRERSAEIMSEQLGRLEEKAAHLNAMTAYLRAKVDWLRHDDGTPEPRFSDHPIMKGPRPPNIGTTDKDDVGLAKSGTNMTATDAKSDARPARSARTGSKSKATKRPTAVASAGR